MEKICHELRSVNKNLVEPWAIGKLRDKTHELDTLFAVEYLDDMFVGPVAKETLPFVYCKDLTALVHRLLEYRNIDDGFHVKIGIDSGGNSLLRWVVVIIIEVLNVFYTLICL